MDRQSPPKETSSLNCSPPRNIPISVFTLVDIFRVLSGSAAYLLGSAGVGIFFSLVRYDSALESL